MDKYRDEEIYEEEERYENEMVEEEKKIKNERALNIINKIVEIYKKVWEYCKTKYKEIGRKKTLGYRVEKIIDELNKGLIGKKDIIRLCVLGVLSKENILLIGPPGTAKSEISRRLTKIFKEESYFEYLILKSTKPEELFGPVDKEGKRNVAGFVLTKKVVFLDEIFNAESDLLNSLLAILNEKQYHYEGKRRNVPLISLIGSSNTIPFENLDLLPVYDRFLIKLQVKYVNEKQLNDLIDVKKASVKVTNELKLTDEELEKIQSNSEKVEVAENIKKTIKEIKEEYNNIFKASEEESLSDRKLVRAVRLLKVSAHINGRKEMDYPDLSILKHCLWNNPGNLETIDKMISDIIKRNKSRKED